MDRLWTVLIWIIFLAALIGALRYWRGGVALLQTASSFFFGETELLSGLNPGTGNVAGYPAFNNQGA